MNSIYVEIDEDSWHQKCFYSESQKKYVTKRKRKQIIPQEFKKMQGCMDFEISELLFHISDITRNPFDYKMSLNNNWAFLRYINCFDSSKELRLRKEYRDVDPHQKTILSDDLGMGFASLFLDKSMKIIAIIDTHLFLKYLPHLKVSKGNKSGASKSPDFIVFDENKNLHLLECKGTQKSKSRSLFQMKKGLEQVDSIIDPKNIVNQRLVIGTYVSDFYSKSHSTITVMDPEFPYNFKDTSKEELIVLTMYFQMLKELSYVIDKKMILKFSEYRIDLKNLVKSLTIVSELLEEIKEYYQKDIIENKFENDEIIITKTIKLSTVFNIISNSKDLKEFTEKICERSKKITENEYIGLYGLHMRLQLKNK